MCGGKMELGVTKITITLVPNRLLLCQKDVRKLPLRLLAAVAAVVMPVKVVLHFLWIITWLVEAVVAVPTTEKQITTYHLGRHLQLQLVKEEVVHLLVVQVRWRLEILLWLVRAEEVPAVVVLQVALVIKVVDPEEQVVATTMIGMALAVEVLKMTLGLGTFGVVAEVMLQAEETEILMAVHGCLVDQVGQEMVAIMDVGVMAIPEMVREEVVQVHVQTTIMDHIPVALEPTVKFVSGTTWILQLMHRRIKPSFVRAPKSLLRVLQTWMVLHTHGFKVFHKEVCHHLRILLLWKLLPSIIKLTKHIT